MKVFDAALPPVFETGVIARRQKFVPICSVEKACTLRKPTTFTEGDDTLSFKVCDTLTTAVKGDAVGGCQPPQQVDHAYAPQGAHVRPN